MEWEGKFPNKIGEIVSLKVPFMWERLIPRETLVPVTSFRPLLMETVMDQRPQPHFRQLRH